jgi:hypothetical protein
VDDASGNITEWMNTSSDGISWSNTNLNQVSATSFTLHAFDGDYAGMAATQDGGFWPTWIAETATTQSAVTALWSQ